eukprot:CCRYP_014771-RA/>CCRYP_014771-RA protein AED:0.06 eAED:-0.07 QI:0/-1/0/1/-1/0/1/0/117
MDFHIAHMLAAWKKEDPLANFVKLIPIQVIFWIASVAQHLPLEVHLLQATTFMIIFPFFCLLWQGEYTNSPSATTPFALNDIHLMMTTQLLNIATDSNELLLQFHRLHHHTEEWGPN